jgi:hypothetical protein
MKYDKLKKVVNAFISTIKDDVTLVYLNVDGISQKRLLTYVGKEPSIECDPETQYKCVLTCYDNLLQQDFTFRMRDVKMYESPTSEIMEKVDNLQNPQQKGQLYTFIYGNNSSKILLREQFNFNFNSDHENLDEVRDSWVDVIRHYRDNALILLDTEKELAVKEADNDALEEIEIIQQMLRQLPDQERLALNGLNTVDEITKHWPPILLPAPDFVK